MTLDRRMTIAAAIAVVLASTVIFPLFSGSLWFYAGIGAVIAVAGAGALSRIRTLPVLLCLAITLAALLLYLNLAFEHSRSLIGIIPTPASLSALGRLIGDGMNDASKYAPGAPNVAGLVLLATGGIGLAAVFTDLIAVRLRSTALAGLPLLVLFTVPVTMNASRSQLATGMIFFLGTSGYLAMLSVDGRERIRVWGRLVSLWRSADGGLKEFGGAPEAGAGVRHAARAEANGDSPAARSGYRVLRGPDTRSLAAAGRRVGFASIVLALCAPVLVPGLHAGHLLSSAWGIGNGDGGGTITVPDPLGTTNTDLRENKVQNVLTYTTNSTDQPYLQQYVTYTLSDDPQHPWQAFPTGVAVHSFGTGLPKEEGLSATEPETTTSIHILRNSATNATGFVYLPAPFPPVSVDGESGSWGVEPSTLMLIDKNGSLAGQNYQVTSMDVAPPGPALSAIPAPPDGGAYQQLPADYTQPELLQLAKEHTAGAKSVYEAAVDLTSWLGTFSYNTFAPPITSSSQLLNYLTQTKTGDCVQSSFAFAVLARLLHIDTRIATGYTSGVRTSPDHYTVRNVDAHAWPEVYFAGYGWIPFEPTPQGQGTAHAPGYDTRPAINQIGTPPVLPSNGTTPGHSGSAGSNTKFRQPGPSGETSALGASKQSTGTPWTAILLSVLAAIALAGGVVALAAPSTLRAFSARPDTPRSRNGIGIGVAVVAIVACGVVAILLYRLMSRTAGLNLGTGWATVGIAFGAAAVAALAVPTACRALLRRWRWLRATDDASRAHAAWQELRADLADFGIGYRPSESPRALAGRVTGSLTLSDSAVEAVNQIALAEERATYAASPASAEMLRRDGVVARRGISAAASRGARWRSRIFPASVMHVVADWTARLAESWSNRSRLRWGSDRWSPDRG
jgi:transglutaminase-like putative cysteine protease